MSLNKHIETFFDWFGDHGCIFPYQGDEKFALVDINSMYQALEYLYLDRKSKTYFVRVRADARRKDLISDSMGIIPTDNDDKENYGYSFIYDKKEACKWPPECQNSSSLNEFLSRHPRAVKLI